MAGHQAKILSPGQEQALLAWATRPSALFPTRNRVMVLLSVKAGLRAIEIAGVTWGMVTDAEGAVADAMTLEDRVSKGGRERRGGRIVPLHKSLRQALQVLKAERGERARPDATVIFSKREPSMSAKSVAEWFEDAYRALDLKGCSSHSGRRTFITRAAKKCMEAGGSVRDVQYLAGHKSLATTQRYIEIDTDAQRKMVDLI